MSRYVQRLLARAAGAPLRALQPAPPLRSAAPDADPFATPVGPEASDLASGAAPREAKPAAAQADWPAVQASTQREPTIAGEASVIGPSSKRSSERIAFDRPLIPLVPPAREAARSLPSSAARADSRDESRMRAIDGSRESGIEARAPHSFTSQPHAGSDVTDSDRLHAANASASAVTLQAAATPRTVPAAAASAGRELPAPTLTQAATNRTADHRQLLVAAPPSATPAQGAAEPAPSRAEVVIGRISVSIESPRPAPVAPRPAPRAAAAPARPAEGAFDSVHHFGIGQL